MDNARTHAQLFRIVEDECPPVPDRFSGPLVAFLQERFRKDPPMRPSSKKPCEKLFENERSKDH